MQQLKGCFQKKVMPPLLPYSNYLLERVCKLELALKLD